MAGQKRKADGISELEGDDVGPVQIPPYDVNKEVPAKSVVISEEYRKLNTGIKHVCSRVTDPLKKSEYKDASSIKVVELTEQRLSDNSSEEIMVSISGNMGSGKSSTINSIFSVGMIARSDKSGSSVTLVPHLYCGPVADQSHRFMIEVSFFSRSEREKFFEEELAAFYRAGTQTDELDEESLDHRRSNAAGDDIDTRDTVADALHSVFLEHRECNTKRATREFLKSAQSEDDPDILNQLNKWADKLIYRIAEDQDSVWLKASTPQEMLKKVEVYSTETTDEESERVLSLWPLVRLIKVHFENPLSKMGVSILDAPGSSDNHIRRETALELKRKCSHAAIVVGAARANNEGSVSKEFNAAKAKGEGRVVVIVTGSDEIDPNTLIGGNSADRQRVTQLQALTERLQNESNALMLQAATVMDHVERSEIYGKKMILDVRLIKAQNAEKATRIAMRSENTKAKLQDKLMDITNSQVPIPVVSISNLDYQKHLLGYNTLQAPTLSVEQTQVPALRQLFAQFPNAARLSEIRHLYTAVLPSAISRVKLFGTSNAADRKADIALLVENAAGRYQPFIENSFTRLSDHFEFDLLNNVKDMEEQWAQKAEELCDDWQAKHKASPFLGLMNRNGLKRHTKKSPTVNLSGDLIHIASHAVATKFTIAVKPIRQEVQEILQDLDFLLKDMNKNINNDPSAPLMDLAPFYEFVKMEKPILKQIVANHIKDFENKFGIIKAKAATEDEDAYLVKEMLPIYEEVRKIKGGKDKIMDKPKIGWGKQRHLTFKTQVTAFDGIWSRSCAAMEQDFKDLVESSKSNMTLGVGQVFERFRSSFEQGCETSDIDEAAQKALQELLRASLEEIDSYVKKELEPAWEALDASNR